MLGFTARHSALETTAAEAQVEASTAEVAREIEKNAKQEQTAAEQAAAFAEVSRIFHLQLQLLQGLVESLDLNTNSFLTGDGQGIYRRANDSYR
jgi:hypothetical protein